MAAPQSVTNVLLIRTHWAHWGAHSGINQFVKYVDPERYAIREHLVPDGDRPSTLLNRLTRPVLRRTTTGLYKFTDLWSEVKAARRVWYESDVVHYLDADHTAFLWPRLTRIRRARPRIVASYHQPPEVLARTLPNHVARAMDVIIVVSPEQAEYFEAIVGPSPIRLIPHGVDTTFFRPSAAPKRAGPLRCLTVGFWLRDFRALNIVAERLSARDDIRFDVVAPETDGLEVRRNVTVHRGLSDDALRALYQDADILFLPLLRATANNALLEGLASGLPVVSTRLPSIETYLGEAEAILVERNDPDQLVSALVGLAADVDRRNRMAVSSRQRAEQLDWQQIAKSYEAVYAG